MTTYFGKPIVCGNWSLVTAWEGQFHNCRCLLKHGENLVEAYSFAQFALAKRRLYALVLTAGALEGLLHDRR